MTILSRYLWALLFIPLAVVFVLIVLAYVGVFVIGAGVLALLPVLL
jgi:hypothetical protein